MTKTVSHKNDTPYFGEEELLTVASKNKFSDMIFELLSERKPNESESKIFETILNISIDHGQETPSAAETIKAASEGRNISEAVAAGILQINDTHGGAIEPAMELLYKVKNENLDIETLVKEYLSEGKRMPGFGHRIYEVDPRTEMLFKLSKELGLSEEFLNLARKIEGELVKQKGKPIPINIDGAIAAILCTFSWNKNLGKAVFIIARVPGLSGQYLNYFK